MSGDMRVKVVDADLDITEIPQPVGYRMLVRPIKIDETTAGGILLPDQSIEEREVLRFIAKVVAQGPECYAHPKFLGGRWCEVGDWILLRQYAGQEFSLRDVEGQPVKVRLVNDDEVLARADSPDALVI